MQSYATYTFDLVCADRLCSPQPIPWHARKMQTLPLRLIRGRWSDPTKYQGTTVAIAGAENDQIESWPFPFPVQKILSKKSGLRQTCKPWNESVGERVLGLAGLAPCHSSKNNLQVRHGDQPWYPRVLWPLRWTIAHSTWMVPLQTYKVMEVKTYNREPEAQQVRNFTSLQMVHAHTLHEDLLRTSPRPRRHGSIALKASDTCQVGTGSRRVTTRPLKKITASKQSPNNRWKIAKWHRMHLNGSESYIRVLLLHLSCGLSWASLAFRSKRFTSSEVLFLGIVQFIYIIMKLMKLAHPVRPWKTSKWHQNISALCCLSIVSYRFYTSVFSAP